MKNTIESDAQISALETAMFLPSESDLAASLPEMGLRELVEMLGGRVTGYIFEAPARMDYVIVHRASGHVISDVNFSQESSFFWGVPMFENGEWKNKFSAKGHDCIRTEIFEACSFR